jgi:hypothetical protein
MIIKGWEKFNEHKAQHDFMHSKARFNVACGGRRSGKSVIGRRRLILAGGQYHKYTDGRFIIGAPTRDQVKRLHWQQLKEMTPRSWVALRNGKTPKISESDLSIELETGTLFQCLGLDKPERAEGNSIDWVLLDEVADMKASAWTLSIRPSLSTINRPGRCDFVGKPRGKGFYYELYQRAATTADWDRFHWKASEILPASEIKQAKADLSELEYRQEYDADWVSFEGRAYYAYEEDVHATVPLDYDPEAPLILTMDFNVQPGTAAVIQEQETAQYNLPKCFAETATAVIGEVYIPNNSNTRLVCRRFVETWGNHRGLVYVYGDATGGARGTAKVDGSDWQLARQELSPVFGDRLRFRIKKGNPLETVRLNAMNARILNANDKARFLVDPQNAPFVSNDFVSVTRLTDGRLDKGSDPRITHLSDGIGYYIESKFPLAKRTVSLQSIL